MVEQHELTPNRSLLDRVRVVLVRPQGPANVGSVCRAMKNMGVSRLVIVGPHCDLDTAESRSRSMHAIDVLRAAQVVDSIPTALKGCVTTFASSAKGGLYRRQARVSAAYAAEMAVNAAGGGDVALAFGPEDHGFKQDELLHFDHVIEIPADPDYPVLNIAGAVLILMYELFQAALAAGNEPFTRTEPWPPAEPPATADRMAILYAELFDALDKIGFFRNQQRDNHLQFALRRALGRAGLTLNEADVLIGMAKQIRWYRDQHPPANSGGD